MVPATLYCVGHVGGRGGAFVVAAFGVVVAAFGVVVDNTSAKIFAASNIKNADLILG